MNERLLENKEIYLAFKNTPEGQNWRDVFNQGLKKIDTALIIERYKRYLSDKQKAPLQTEPYLDNPSEIN